MTTAAGLGLLSLGALLIWSSVSNRQPLGMIRAGFTGGSFEDVGPIDS